MHMRLLIMAMLVAGAAPLAAQPTAVTATRPTAATSTDPAGVAAVATVAIPAADPAPVAAGAPAAAAATAVAPGPAAAGADVAASQARTFREDDVLGAAEDLFGRGAEGLGEIVRKTFKSYGEPNAYIVGREIGGAFVVGLRYGAGTLHHRIEGERPVHWSGPSIGFDVGGDGSKVFALVYDLNDSEELFRRYPAAEGKAYFVGGFTAEYLQRDNVIIVPIKLGVGVRLGLNAGYMNFTKKGSINPF
jgi:hypothetical protein